MRYITIGKAQTLCLTVITAFAFFSSCSHQEQGPTSSEMKNENSVPPQILAIKDVKVVNLDTCKPPLKILIPEKPGGSYKEWGTTIPLVPPVAKPAGFFVQMKNYGTEQGLNLSAIACGYMDKIGNLWFGTYGGGVCRYDGYKFTSYTSAQGMGDNLVTAIMEDRNGNMWFGTSSGGVSRYDGKSFTTFGVKQGLHKSVRSIAEDNEGNIWFATGNGAFRYNGKTFKHYTAEKGLADDYTYKIIKDKKGNLWFCTAKGASCFDGKIFTNYTTEQGLPENPLSCVAEDKEGNIWFGTSEGNISCFDGRSFINHSPGRGEINCITQDKHGNMWFGTQEGGALAYDGKSFTVFSIAEGLANNVVSSITEDKTGSLWFGTYGAGLSRYDGKSFTSFSAAQGLGHDVVWAIGEDKKGNMWFGTSGAGVARYDGTSFTNFTTKQGLSDDIVYGIIEDKKGNIWFGTATAGLSCYDGTSFTHYTKKQGLGSNIIWCMASDSKGNMWFATQGNGVTCFDGKSFTTYKIVEGPANDMIYSILEDKKGNMWFGTEGGGVSCFDGKKFTVYTTAQGLAYDQVYSMAEDGNGNIWFACYGGGISRYDGKSFISFSKTHGLADDNVTQILEDKDGAIWMGTNWGISKLNFKEPESAKLIPGDNSLTNEELKNHTPIFETYNQRTGYPVKDVNVGLKCMLLDSKGIIWAATGDIKTALVRFDPSALNHNPAPPPLFIQSIKINGENISWNGLSPSFSDKKKEKDSLITPAHILEEVNTFDRILSESERNRMRKKFEQLKFDTISRFYPVPQNLVLPHNHNNISFEFAAVEPAKSFLVQYQYILEGYDKNWSLPTNKTTATFGNIYEGDYTFKVKAQSPEGIWSEPVTYTFKVLPPWYRTWWMYSADGITAFVLLFGVYRWRTASLRKDKENLEKTVKERTAEVIQQKEEAEEQKHIVEEKQREILDSIHYAKKIQEALLGEEEHVSKHLPSHFILFKPKDIISGDFYWSQEKQGHLYLAAADCTGHGVPGALMSMLGIAFLNEITSSDHLLKPAEILNLLREKVVKELGSSGQTKDGMDISLCRIDLKTNELVWAGANNPLWIIKKDSGESSLQEIKSDKQTIGYNEVYKPYTDHIFKNTKGTFYLFTDGYADQFGGPKGKKFMYKPLKERLLAIADQPLETQKEILLNTFEDWKGDLAQVDDVCIIAIRIG